MVILSKNREQIINIENLTNITIMDEYGINEKVNEIQSSSIIGEKYNTRIYFGTYETKDRAQEILLDIYSKLTENKSCYKMPEK